MSSRINLNTERYFCPDDSLKTCKTEQKIQIKASKRKTETIKVNEQTVTWKFNRVDFIINRRSPGMVVGKR
jgi:hypothetical protein